jgi:hypothetical protein
MAIDDWLQARALPGAMALFDKYFGPQFRWVEFSLSVGGAYAAIKALAVSLAIGAASAHTMGLAAAGIAALAYFRNPKTAAWVEPAGPAQAEPDAGEGKALVMPH